MITIPKKEFYNIKEVAQFLAGQTGQTFEAARQAIYRAIDRGDVNAKKFISGKMISREQTIQILQGKPL